MQKVRAKITGQLARSARSQLLGTVIISLQPPTELMILEISRAWAQNMEMKWR